MVLFASIECLLKHKYKLSLIGFFRLCIADKIVTAGGKKRMKEPRYYYPGEKPYRMIYMEDPFGNIIEIYSHSYELYYASGAYN